MTTKNDQVGGTLSPVGGVTPSAPTVEPPAPPTISLKPSAKTVVTTAAAAETAVPTLKVEAKTGGPGNPLIQSKGPTVKNKGEDSVFNQVLVVALTSFTRDQQLTLAKTLAGALGGHLTFPEARDNRMRGELLELITGGNHHSGQPQKGKVRQTGKPGGEKKEKKQKGTNPAKQGSRELRSSPESKHLAECQKALRDERVRLGIPKGNQSDPRLDGFIAELNKAKEAFYKVRDQVRGTSL